MNVYFLTQKQTFPHRLVGYFHIGSYSSFYEALDRHLSNDACDIGMSTLNRPYMTPVDASGQWLLSPQICNQNWVQLPPQFSA